MSLKSREELRKDRRRRVLLLLRYLGLSAVGISISVTLRFIQTAQWQLAIVSAIATISITFLTLSAKFFSEVTNTILDRIEERLETQAEPLAEFIVNGLENLVVGLWWNLTSHFQAKYYQSLIYANCDYRTQGLRTKSAFILKLDKVLVPLRVLPEAPERISPVIISQNIEAPGLTIWDFLAASRNHSGYRSIAIIGAPGSGKTTLLQSITLNYAKKTQHRQHRKAPTLIPLLIYLRDVKEVIVAQQPTLGALIQQQDYIYQLKPPLNWFENKLRYSTCLVMLDGLDEVADIERQQVSRWISQQIRNYPKAFFILTSRPFGYISAPVEEIRTILEVLPFNLNQMEQFIHNWYLQSEIMRRLGRDDPGVRVEAQRQADDLIQRIRESPPLAAMAVNPLLLTMIATVHSYRGALPGNRVEFYAEICDVLLGRRWEAKGIPEVLSSNQKKVVLQRLALELMKSATREFTLELGSTLIHNDLARVAGSRIKPRAFLADICNRSGLLVEREKGIYEFAHVSFQEYLASVQIKETNQEALLIENINNYWWHETIRLYVAQSDATNLIQAALANPTISSLTLALDCLEEGLRIDPEVRQQLYEQLEDRLNSSEPEVFKIAAEVRLARRLAQFVRIDENIEIDTSYVTCAEYQLFLDDSAESLFPEHWQSNRFPSEDAKKPITGISWQDAHRFCAWLSSKESLHQSTRYYRLPTDLEKQNYPSKDDESLGENRIRLVRFHLNSQYSKLYYYLSAGEWKKADQETYKIMLQVASKNEGYLDVKDIDNFPCEDLRTIDKLWVHYSKGLFGFSVQKKIWQEFGGKRDINTEHQIEYLIGWLREEERLDYSNLTFDLNAPIGHLPGFLVMLEQRSILSAFIQRAINCGL